MVVILKIGQNIEFAYEHGVEFFVRLPLLGDVLGTNPGGWQYWTWREVKAQRAAGVL
jgi:hypothetical protein